MSRNFELLRRADRDTDVLPQPFPSSSASNGNRHRLNLDLLSREETAKLIQRVFLATGNDSPRTVVFCGVGPGDGCTNICAHTSEMLAAEAGKPVCIIDGNLRSPALHTYFGVPNQRGLAEFVMELGPIGDFVQRVRRGGNLCLLSSGRPAVDPHALLSSEQVQRRLVHLRSEFHFVLIDSPPINLYADAISLARLADGVVLIIHANTTRREAARKAKATLESADVRLLGAVLNRRTFPIPEALYSLL